MQSSIGNEVSSKHHQNHRCVHYCMSVNLFVILMHQLLLSLIICSNFHYSIFQTDTIMLPLSNGYTTENLTLRISTNSSERTQNKCLTVTNYCQTCYIMYVCSASLCALLTHCSGKVPKESSMEFPRGNRLDEESRGHVLNVDVCPAAMQQVQVRRLT